MKPNCSNLARTLLITGMLAAAVVSAPVATVVYASPAAHAEGGIPDPGVPDPDPDPQPAAQPRVGEGECEYGQVVDPNTGDCIPAMAGLGSSGGEQPIEEPAPRMTQDITESSTTGVGANLVPNINGDSCTGYWQSVACSEMEQDNVAVQPRSTLSSSP